METYTGCFFSLLSGNGYVKLDNGKEIYIYSENRGTAMHKDIVEARITGMSHEKTIGGIIRVLERGNKFVLGNYDFLGKRAVCVPDDKKIAEYIYLEEKKDSNMASHKIAVKITKPQNADRYAEGKIIMDLGHKDAPGVDILAVVYKMEIPYVFSRKAAEEAERLPDEINITDYPKRVNLTDRTTVTIDSEDTKDIDDAVSLERLENGNFRLTVSIADVTHYVTEGSPLDKDAFKRGTSVYLADRVIPMLPQKLSNGICSLNEGVFRLALSCEMEIDKSGNVIDHKIYESIIKVDKKMTYEKVNLVLKNDIENAGEDYVKYIPLISDMNELWGILKNKRVERGALEFDFPEAKIVLDTFGNTTDVVLRERNAATGIIEEFMVLCNETVAEEYYWLELPFVYRCHEEPDTYRRQRFTEFLKNLGYSLKGKASKSYQTLLLKAQNTLEEAMIGKVMLRSLQQARYMDVNIGHFGLASKRYCHFTSPIRRYPDLQIHRIIKENINGRMDEERINHYGEILPEVCEKCSLTERRAQNCEREVENLKKIEYMSDKLGNSYDGIISGITSWGIYVSLENTVEGMVSLSGIEDDYYVFDEAGLSLKGERTQKTYRLGQRVRVCVTRADVNERKLDFKLV